MNIENYISSGIIEMYVMGVLSDEESQEVRQLSSTYPEISAEIGRVSSTLENYARVNEKSPSPSVKPFLMATLDYMKRIETGEVPAVAPALNKETKAVDFEKWLNRADMQAPEVYDGSFAKIISHTPTCSTAIVWLKNGAPKETHDNQFESFFILEGSCDVIVNNEMFQLFPGDQFTVPLHSTHYIRVTSSIPCKLILERKAA